MRHKRSIISVAMATIMLVSLCAVCASVSVSAAPSSSKASVKATPDLVGAPIATGTGPAACVLQGSTSMYVFVKGYDGALWFRVWSTATYYWSGGWFSLGGQLSSSPCAVSRSPGVLDVYVRDMNGGVCQKTYYNGVWHDWYSLGGYLAPSTGPGASGWAGREDVFVAGADRALYQKTWTAGSGWTTWARLGGYLTSSPAAASRQAGIIDVYGRGSNGAVYERPYYSGTWHNWYDVGGQVAPGTGPAVSAYGTDREDVFAEGTNGALYQKTWTAGPGWFSWVNLGAKLTSSPTVATYTFVGTIDIQVFVRGTDGALWLREYFVSAWFDWLPSISQGPP